MQVAIRQLSLGSPQDETAVKRVVNKPTLSVYSNGTGFAVVSRDNRYPALLAYGSGDFTITEMPEGLKWWLETVQRSMANDLWYDRIAQRVEAVQPVAPLLTTKWGQDSPFNNYAPSLKIANDKKAPAGCVAIAMAQVMNYHRYPASARFTGSYTIEGSDEQFQATVSSTYSWPYNDYYSYYFPEGTMAYEKVSTSPRLGNLVATLCRDCAYAVGMQYTSTGSGAWTYTLPQVMADCFGYSIVGSHYYERYFYTDDEWHGIVCSELEQGCPLLFTGYDADTGGGHAFVCDGVDGSGLVHINWGWSGLYDGYFEIDLLNPSTEQYSEYQSIVVLRPQALDHEAYGSLVATAAPFTMSYDNESRKLYYSTDGIYNYCGKNIEGGVSVVFQNITVPDSVDYLLFMDGDTLPPQWGWGAFSDSVEVEFHPGEYHVYLASKDVHEDEWQTARTAGGPFYLVMYVDERKNVTFAEEPVYTRGTDTGIRSLSLPMTVGRKPDSRLYDMGGRIINSPRKGLYIQNGKKYFQ